MEASLNGPLGQTSLGQGTLKIGRAPNNTLVISDPQASARHVEITDLGGNGYQVTDLGSTNGTFVNEQRLTANVARLLNNGDVIRIGALRFTYEASSGYAPTVAANSINDDPTVPSQLQQGAQPTLYPQPPAGGYNAPAQPPTYTPPQPPITLPPAPAAQQPVYPQAQPGYPQPQPGYPQAQPAAFNQAGYPLQQPGGFGQAYPQPKKKSRVGLWIGLVVLLLLVVGGGIGGYVYINRSTPEKTLQAYCTALQNNDAQGMYNTYSSEAQAQTDVNRISQGLQLIKLLIGSITNCSYSNVVVNGNNATATLTFTTSRGQTRSGATSLIYENNQWKMSPAKAIPAT
jgi:hypothetical protein